MLNTPGTAAGARAREWVTHAGQVSMVSTVIILNACSWFPVIERLLCGLYALVPLCVTQSFIFSDNIYAVVVRPMVKKVVLAYSGGLDTSVCIPLLRENYGFDKVVTVTVDVGQPAAEIKTATEKAKLISDKHYTIDAKDEFVNDYIFPMIKANAMYEGYVIGTSMARPLIARKCVDVARKEKADALAHGCTGKGNDQLRFEAVFRQTDLPVVAPMREMNLTREWEIDYAKKHKIPVSVTKKKPWSVDENIWSRSIEGGKLEDPGFIPPEEIYEWTQDPVKAPDKPEIVAIGFAKGVPVCTERQEAGRRRARPGTP